MWKKIASLNLSLLMLVMLLPINNTYAAEGDDIGYAIFHKNDGSENEETAESTVWSFSSNGVLCLYEEAPYISGEGKVVTSYNTQADGEGTSYKLSSQLRDSYSTDASAPTDLYAQWTDAPDKYIFYIGASGAFSDGNDYCLQSGLSGQVALLGEDAFSSTADTKVVGWSTLRRDYFSFLEDNNQIFKVEEAVDLTENLVLYPVMGCNYITFHYTNISGVSDSKTLYYHNGNNPLIPYVYYPDNPSTLPLISHTKGSIFVGWNSEASGDGSWYSDDSSPESVPVHDLYAQYEKIPDKDYCILNTTANDGEKPRNIIMLEDGKTSLPSEAGGKRIAYWLSGRFQNEQRYYPTGTDVTVETGTELRAVYAQAEGVYFSAIIDGAGGKTKSGSEYSAAQYYITSFGDMSLYTLDEMDRFVKDGNIEVGYTGSKTGQEYPLDAPAGETIHAEADDDNIARFTAIYEPVNGNYIQYKGNGAKTEDGKAYYVQDNLQFDGSEGEKYIENKFVAPSGKHFLGWNTAASGYGVWCDPGTTIDLPQNVILYAIWGRSRIVYHIPGPYPSTYYNMFSGSSSEIIMPGFGDIPSTHIFEGWCTAQEGEGDWYYFKDEVPEGVILHLYERLIERPKEGYYCFLISPKVRTRLVTLNHEQDELTLPETNYAGWKDSDTWIPLTGFVDAEPNIYPSGASMTVKSGSIITAFDPESILRFHINLPAQNQERTFYSCASYGNLRLYDVADVFSDIPADKEFKEWNTCADGSGDSYTVGENYFDLDLDLYAIWNDIVIDDGGGSNDDDYGDYDDYYDDYTPSDVTQSTVNADGSVTQTTTHADSTKTKTTTTKDGVVGKTEFDAEGRVTSIEVAVPAGSEGIVTAPVEVESTTDSAKAPEIRVKSPVGTGTVVEIPVTNAGPGTVAVKVYPDGTEEVIRDCVGGDCGIVFSVEGDVTIRIVDRGGTFDDMADSSWASDAVAFVSARELFNGTGTATFSPGKEATRGMLVTVLYRLAYEPDHGSDVFPDVLEGQYYSDAVAWAADEKIVNGCGNGSFYPDENVTREQMVTMLYRYAVAKGVKADKADNLVFFPDAAEVSDYAREAMNWAVGAGIINGIGGKLSPATDATRAQMATVMMRLCEHLAK